LFCILSRLRDILNLRCGCNGCCGRLLLLWLWLWLKLRLLLLRPQLL